MASGDEVKVLGSWASPYVMRVRFALNLKGVSYEFLQQQFGTNSELVYKKIPVLLHNGKPVCESMIIVQYIDEVWSSVAPALLPSDPYDRAMARFWAVYVDDKFLQWLPAIGGVGMGTTAEARAEAAEQLTAGLQLLEEAFEKCSKGKGFFGGETIGYLDIAVGSHLVWLRVTEQMFRVEFLNTEKTPLLAGWAERFCADPAVKEVVPETEKLVEYYANVVKARFKA